MTSTANTETEHSKMGIIACKLPCCSEPAHEPRRNLTSGFIVARKPQCVPCSRRWACLGLNSISSGQRDPRGLGIAAGLPEPAGGRGARGRQQRAAGLRAWPRPGPPGVAPHSAASSRPARRRAPCGPAALRGCCSSTWSRCFVKDGPARIFGFFPSFQSFSGCRMF